jgi:hypothetical protein
MFRFLTSPPSVFIDPSYNPTFNAQNYSSTWNADVHLVSTYCFLSKEEAKRFATEDQIYLVKDVMRYNFENITGSKRVQLQSTGMVSNWMIMFQRNDIYLRNQWSNYTNWPYEYLPSNITIGQQGSTNNEVVYVRKFLSEEDKKNLKLIDINDVYKFDFLLYVLPDYAFYFLTVEKKYYGQLANNIDQYMTVAGPRDMDINYIPTWVGYERIIKVSAQNFEKNLRNFDGGNNFKYYSWQ